MDWKLLLAPLLAPLLALVGALVGSAVGDLIGPLVSDRRADRKWLREQRLELYAEVIAVTTTLAIVADRRAVGETHLPERVDADIIQTPRLTALVGMIAHDSVREAYSLFMEAYSVIPVAGDVVAPLPAGAEDPRLRAVHGALDLLVAATRTEMTHRG